jgi:hypothetical protein
MKAILEIIGIRGSIVFVEQITTKDSNNIIQINLIETM